MATNLPEAVQDIAAAAQVLYDRGQKQEWLSAMGTYQEAAQHLHSIRLIMAEPFWPQRLRAMADIHEHAAQQGFSHFDISDCSDEGKMLRATATAHQDIAEAVRELADRLSSPPSLLLTSAGTIGAYYDDQQGRAWASFSTGAAYACDFCGAQISSGYYHPGSGDARGLHVCSGHATINGTGGVPPKE